MSLKGRNFLKLLDFTPDEINELLDLAVELKEKKKSGVPHRMFEGKSIALIFEKTSTRTRCAFSIGDRLLLPDLRAARIEIHRVHAEIRRRNLEGTARAGTRLFKDQRDAFALKHPVRNAGFFLFF